MVEVNGDKVPVPCNKCPLCIKRRISGWSFRLMQQNKIAISAEFITLTYDSKNVPITRNGYMTLRKKDCQDFFKRLRKAQFGSKGGNIKYYCAGEYGSITWRPHYHIIMFNSDRKLIDTAWNKGIVHYGATVEEASVGYTLKYISKPRRIPLHRNDDREPESALMSKGLGKNYLTPAMVEWHLADIENRMYINVGSGKKAAMPKYYKDRIYTDDQRAVINAVQMHKGIEERNKLIEKIGNEEYDRVWEESKIAAFTAANINSKKTRNKV